MLAACLTVSFVGVVAGLSTIETASPTSAVQWNDSLIPFAQKSAIQKARSIAKTDQVRWNSSFIRVLDSAVRLNKIGSTITLKSVVDWAPNSGLAKIIARSQQEPTTERYIRVLDSTPTAVPSSTVPRDIVNQMTPWHPSSQLYRILHRSIPPPPARQPIPVLDAPTRDMWHAEQQQPKFEYHHLPQTPWAPQSTILKALHRVQFSPPPPPAYQYYPRAYLPNTMQQKLLEALNDYAKRPASLVGRYGKETAQAAAMSVAIKNMLKLFSNLQVHS